MATSDLSPESEPQSNFAREVFLKNYDKLSNLRLEVLASSLVTNKVITVDDHEAIREAGTVNKKSAIILRAISSHLEVEEAESFFLLLDLMELHGDFIMQKIAGKMKRQLGCPSRGGGGEIEVSGDQPRRIQIDFSQLSIDSAFSALTSNICAIFKSHHNLDFYSLRRACFENVNTLFGATIPGELIDQIRSTDNLNDLFDVLALSPSYWSWINIRILKKMAAVSCLDEANQLIEKYEEAVFSRKLSQAFKEIPEAKFLPDYYTKIEQKWDKSLDAVTVKDLVTKWSKMEEVFNIKEPTLVLQKVVDGCVEIHWLIPTQLVDHVSSAVFNARHEITSNLYLKIDGHVILGNDEEHSDTRPSSIIKENELSQSSLIQYLYSSHSIRPSMVVQVFNSLVDHVVSQMLQSASHKEHLHHCESLMASDALNISLFSEEQLKELNECNDNSALLQNLRSLWTWSDHSILEALASSCDEAVKLITQFDSRLDRSKLISTYPILSSSHDAAPGDNSPFTVLAITCDQVIYHSPMQFIFDMRELVISKCDITPHCLQLLAARGDPTVLYWTIPKCIVSLVITKVLECRKAFHEEMISEVSIYPTTRIVTHSDRMVGSLFHLLPAVPAGSSTEEEEMLPEASERARLKSKWLSQPEVLSAVLDNFISDIKRKDEDIFQLKLDHHRMSKLYQYVMQKKGQLQADVKAMERGVAEYKELYEKKAESFEELVLKTEQEKKAMEQPSPPPPVEAEEAMKKVHAALHDFRACFQETIISYNVDIETTSEKQWKTTSSSISEEYGDPTSAKLLMISKEIMAATNDMGQNIELQRVVVTKLQEAESKVKELEAQVTNVNKSKDKMLQNVANQSGQLQDKLEVLKSQIVEHKKWCAGNAKHFYEFVLTKKMQLRKELEQFCSTGKVEDAIKKLQVSWEGLRSCFEDTASRDSHRVSEELAEKQFKDSEDDNDLNATLDNISQEIIKAKGWTSKLKERNLELQKTLDKKSKEAEDMNIRLKQLETDDTNTIQVEELKKLKKENKLLLKKVTDLRIDVTKPEKSHFGTGRYGETYKMNHKGTWCSAKVLHKTLLSSAKSNEDFIAGVKKYCSTLHHTNLVAFIGVTEVDKRPAILTELMEVNLFTYIQQNNELTLDLQVSLCKDMCRGLEELHKHSLLHNNLHHRNILIQDNRAKLTDYYYPLLQFEGTTPDYADTAPFVAPEVIENRSNCSQSSDIYSLAVLCLKVITGETAVQLYKQNVATIVQEHILLPLLHQCLSDEVDKRPSAARMWNDIKTIQDSPQYISFEALKQKNSMPLFQAVKAGTKRLEWRTCATMPAPLVGANAVVLDNVIYVSGGESQDEFASRYVFAYHLLENRWEKLPQLTHSHGVPVAISNKLVIIGGKDCKSRRFTNQVSTYNHTEQKWESVYPNLSKERYGPLAVNYKHYVIVGGGKYRAMPLYDRFYDDIEIMNTEDDLIWRKVPTRLPAKMWCPSVTISNDQLWVVGFNNDNSGSLNLIEQRSEEIFWIPVNNVVSTDKKGKWEPLPRVVPYYSSTVVPYSSPIVTVGGDTEDTKTVCAIEMHNDSLGAWEQVASLEEPSRAYVTVACIGEQQAIIVLGGCTQTRNKRSRQDSSLALIQIGYGV